MGDLMVLYATQQVHQRLDVVLEVEQGLFDRFAHAFVGGEMNNAFNVGMFFKNGFCIVQGTKVYLVMRDLFSGDGFDAQQHAGIGAAVVVDGNDFVSLFEEIDNGV